MDSRTQIAFLQKASGRPFQWGQEDCALFLANWWRHVHGVDPAHWLQGGYDSEDGAAAIIAANRGLQRLVARVAKEAGAGRTREPARGDFGLIAHNGKPFGAICVCPKSPPDTWAVRAKDGIAFIHRPRILQAWEIGGANGA